jgi:hypothetical protein
MSFRSNVFITKTIGIASLMVASSLFYELNDNYNISSYSMFNIFDIKFPILFYLGGIPLFCFLPQFCKLPIYASIIGLNIYQIWKYNKFN